MMSDGSNAIRCVVAGYCRGYDKIATYVNIIVIIIDIIRYLDRTIGSGVVVKCFPLMGVGKVVCHRLERKHHHCHCHYRSAQWLAEFCFFCHNYSALKFYYRKDTIFFTVSITKTEKNREYPFNPCSQNNPIPSLHSLSFQLLSKHRKLTIFNSFNSIAHEFSVERNLLEIFRVFKG